MTSPLKLTNSNSLRNSPKSRIGVLSAAITALFAAPGAYASPVVNGLEISWPDDGYYQVQTADGLTNICEGTRSCLVEPGQYIVINHTSGERFTDVDVTGSVAVSEITVSGNTISWPDDGYYQVQTADGLSNICENTQSCVVEPGEYIVINHTTGTRYEGIVVAGEEPGENTDSVVVDGNTISWPDDGWYQVQSAETFESLCQGGNSCDVPAGTYIVINLTTGERFTDIVVDGGNVIDSPATDALALDDISNDLLFDLAGFELEENAGLAPEITAEVISSNTGVVALDAGEFTVEDRGSEITVPTERSQYVCAEGGTMTVETGVFQISESDYSHSTDLVVYDFDSCQASITAGVPVADTYLVDGTLTTLQDDVSGSGFQTAATDTTYTGFDLRGEMGVIVTVDADISAQFSNSNDSFVSRDVAISEYVLQLEGGEDAQPVVSISDATLTQQFSTTANGGLSTFFLDVSGVISGELTEGVEVLVSTVAPLNRTLAVGPLDDQNIPFNGQLQMSATDGSELTISANPEVGEDQSLLVDYTFLNSDGEMIDSLGQQFSESLSTSPM